ncbi:hypothetical protein Tco_0640017 [Tanacetum coccineum]
MLAKPHHVIAPSSFRNSLKESYGSKDMSHNYFIEEARKMTHERNRNFKPREMPSTRTNHTPNTCKPKPRSNNQTSRNWPASKSRDVTLKVVQKADHSRNPSSFSDSKHFVYSTCQKYVFNANHDACVTKLLKEVNYRVKVQSSKTRNNNKLVEQKSHTQTPVRQIFTRHRFSPNKPSVVHEKPSPRSFLRWKPTGKVFKTIGLRWILTGKLFASSTTKVDSESPHASNANITNPYECIQTLDIITGTLNLDTGLELQLMTLGTISLGLVQNPSSPTSYVPPTKNDWDMLFQPIFDEYFNPPPSVVSLAPTTTAPRPADLIGSPSSTSVDQAAPSASTSSTIQETQSPVIPDGVEEQFQPA